MMLLSTTPPNPKERAYPGCRTDSTAGAPRTGHRPAPGKTLTRAWQHSLTRMVPAQPIVEREGSVGGVGWLQLRGLRPDQLYRLGILQRLARAFVGRAHVSGCSLCVLRITWIAALSQVRTFDLSPFVWRRC